MNPDRLVQVKTRRGHGEQLDQESPAQAERKPQRIDTPKKAGRQHPTTSVSSPNGRKNGPFIGTVKTAGTSKRAETLSSPNGDEGALCSKAGLRNPLNAGVKKRSNRIKKYFLIDKTG
jgi:hypothetical protein